MLVSPTVGANTRSARLATNNFAATPNSHFQASNAQTCCRATVTVVDEYEQSDGNLNPGEYEAAPWRRSPEEYLPETELARESQRNSMGMSTTVVCLLDAQNAGSPFCSTECLAQWLKEKQPGNPRVAITQRKWACSHCTWCGAIILEPDSCAIHGEGHCLPVRWEVTSRAMDLFHAWRKMTGTPVTDEVEAELFGADCSHPSANAVPLVLDVIRKMRSTS